MRKGVKRQRCKKLEKYRECANRDRFILPEDADISLFTNTVDSCVSFFEE
jgi:hypothetical protein